MAGKAGHAALPTPEQEQPGLPIGTPDFATGRSSFTLIFHTAVRY